nr:copia protein [Tanacetum cinerariifolium]
SLDNDNSALKLLKHENDRLMELLISQDLMHTTVNSLATINDYKTIKQSFVDEYKENMKLQTELVKKNDMIEKDVYNKLLKWCSDLKINHNRDAHANYLKHTEENVYTLREIIEHIRELRPLESNLDSAYKFVTRIQEFLVYVNETCPNIKLVSNKLVTVTPMNKTSGHLNDVNARVKSKSMKSRFAKSKKRKCGNLLGCSKHMIGQRSQLINFVSKFLGTVRYVNDQIAKIMSYGDYQLRNVTILWVYYVEGIGHNLFSIGQFCDSDLEVSFRKHTCYVWNLDGDDLLSRSRDINLYTISLDDMLKSSPICLLSKASKTKSWLWHRQLSHLNFGKSKMYSHKPKVDDTNQEKLYLLHMDLYGPIRVESIN